MTKVTIIAGGHSVQSRLTGILHHVQQHLTINGIDVRIIQVHQLPSSALIRADFSNEEVVKAIELVNESDGVIVLTPVYKASFSGILKRFRFTSTESVTRKTRPSVCFRRNLRPPARH